MANQLAQLAIKLIFTIGLLIIIGLSTSEIWRIWFERKLVLTPFAFTRDGTQMREAGQNFTLLLARDLKLLRDVYSGKLRSGDVSIPSTDQMGRGLDVSTPLMEESVFSDLEIEAYGVQISAIARSLLRFVERPNEITGSVSETDKGIDIYAELRSGRSEGDLVPWYISQVAEVEDASFATACRVFHSLLIKQSALYEKVSANDFCAFTRALRSYQLYRNRLAEAASEEVARVHLSEASRVLTNLIGRGRAFPFVHKLAAYVYHEEDRSTEAERAMETYLRQLKNYESTDKAAEDFLASLNRRATVGQTNSVMSAEQLGLQRRARPLKPGVSIATTQAGAGTMCCLVQDEEGVYMLSTDHVLVGGVGDPVFQPAPLEKVGSEVVATISRIKVGEPSPERNQAVGAIAKLETGLEWTSELPGLGPLKGTAKAVVGDRIRVVGRTSGIVEGEVIEVDSTTQISFGDSEGPRIFDGMITTTSVSSGGDSGAPVVNDDNELVGIVYGGSQSVTIVMPIGPVLEVLEVELLLGE